MGKFAKAVLSCFVKNLNKIPKIPFPSTYFRQMALKLDDKGLVGKFTDVYPSPISMVI
jgi:hypothetical protein